jgi:hypothetical protein
MVELGLFINVPLTSFPISSNGGIVDSDSVAPPFRFFVAGALFATTQKELRLSAVNLSPS